LRFWDSSALVPLVLEEARSPTCRATARGDRDAIVWMFTETEVLAAIHRARLANRLSDDEVGTAERRLERLARAWKVVVDAPTVQKEAREVIRRHRIRAADSLQLAAALLWAKGRPKGRGFVVADHDLALAATADGFDVKDLS
jgi:predicted nucleic acid-binding protein